MKKYKCNRCLKTAHNRDDLKCFRCDKQKAEAHGMDTTGITFVMPSVTIEGGNDASGGNDYSSGGGSGDTNTGGGGDFGGGGASSDF